MEPDIILEHTIFYCICINIIESFCPLQSDETYNILLHCINITESFCPLQSDETYNILLHCINIIESFCPLLY